MKRIKWIVIARAIDAQLFFADGGYRMIYSLFSGGRWQAEQSEAIRASSRGEASGKLWARIEELAPCE